MAVVADDLGRMVPYGWAGGGASGFFAEAVASVRLDGETHTLDGDGSGVSAHNAGLGSAEIAAPGPGSSPRHLHTPGREPVVLGERFVGGARFVVYACCTCGEALPERRA